MDEVLNQLPGYLLRRASSASLAELSARLSPFDLTVTEVSLLMLIAASPGVTQSALCRTLGIKRANMTPLIARLEKRGLVSKAPVDKRSQGLELTGEGKRLHRSAAKAIRAYEDELIARVPKVLRPSVIPILSALWHGSGG